VGETILTILSVEQTKIIHGLLYRTPEAAFVELDVFFLDFSLRSPSLPQLKRLLLLTASANIVSALRLVWTAGRYLLHLPLYISMSLPSSFIVPLPLAPCWSIPAQLPSCLLRTMPTVRAELQFFYTGLGPLHRFLGALEMERWRRRLRSERQESRDVGAFFSDPNLRLSVLV
jgi:hypothetical protein